MDIIRRILYFCIIESVLMISCTTKTTPLTCITEADTDSILLQKTPDMELWCSDLMYICDSCLIIIDRCQTDKLHIFQLSDFKFIKSYGRTGKGPLDCIFPFFLQNDILPDNTFSIYDSQLVKCKTFKVNYKQQDSLICLIKDANIPAQILASTDMAQIGNNYYGTQDSGRGLFFIHNIDKDTTIWIPYPSTISNFSKRPINANQSRIIVNHKKKKIFAAMRYYNQLFLYDTNGILVKSGCFGKKLIPSVVNGQIVPTAEIFFSKIYSTDKYIYLILSDQTYGTSFTTDLPPSKIAIFDWNLNHIQTLQTNIIIHSMIYDSIYHRMIVLSSDAEENAELYTFPWKEK